MLHMKFTTISLNLKHTIQYKLVLTMLYHQADPKKISQAPMMALESEQKRQPILTNLYLIED